ncbi:MAG TPA: hypothetical protein VFM93_05680 [Candidatus Limnocylindria bacterium]|nr:hypothetical protein [Candidatus Limnocylindria bacterium]
MILEVGHGDVPARAPRALLGAAAVALAAAAASSSPGPLVGAPAIELTRFPDRYLNEPVVLAVATSVAVRGTTGVVTQDGGATTLMWTEGGTVYRLTSRGATVDMLVRVAAHVR